MSFTDTISPVQACPGVELTAIADRDGITVQSWGGKRSEVEEFIGEFANFFHEIVNANRELQLGDLEQVVVAAEQKTVIVTTIVEGYYLMTVVNPDGLAGKARFTSRVAAYHLKREFM
ncbi:MAG: roadblock/LC7 domain-containing protein [Acidobacteria bacterium]|nr:roadblock/LC7 domain-containing protein [Acidobacteriota bacterium]